MTIGVVFDFDGVLVDTETLYAHAHETLFTTLGISVSPSEYREFLGTKPQSMWSTLKIRFELSSDVKHLVRLAEDAKLRQLDAVTHIQPIKGIPELLNGLLSIGARLGVTSSSSARIIEPILQRTGLRKFFTAIITGDIDIPGKPEADPYLLAAESLQLPPRDCVAIEDSPSGITSAKSAGMRCIAVETRMVAVKALSDADLIVRDFSLPSRKRIGSFVSKAVR